MTVKTDILIFGASGFTGKHTIPYLAKFTKDTPLIWGVAGRSHQKLKSALESYKNSIGKPIDDIPIIIADVTDEASLREMARSTKVVINCCGPFLLYGEPVVRACVEEGTHHVDVTGEVPFIKEMIEKYDARAREKGVFVISCCGVDSIPADLGLVFLEKNFEGSLNSVDVFLESEEEEGDRDGSYVNYGTYESMVHVLGKGFNFGELFEKSGLEPHHSLKLLPHKPDGMDGWAIPFPATDRFVLKMSQNHFYKENGKRPIQAESYVVAKSFIGLILLMFFAVVVFILSQFGFGRNLLLKYPGFFTNGFVTHENPSEGRTERNIFVFTLCGHGWTENTRHDVVKPNKKMIVKVKGRNMGYGTTCICLALSAITILTEMNKMPKAGVISPGYAFAETSIIEKLQNSGITFEVVKTMSI